MNTNSIEKIREFVSHLSFSLFGQSLYLYISKDKKWGERVYMQLFYNSPCSKTGEIQEWRGRKWYLSPHMTESEVVFTALSAFKMAVEHELLEGFKFDGQTVVNPHIDFRKLLEISPHEVKREQISNFDI